MRSTERTGEKEIECKKTPAGMRAVRARLVTGVFDLPAKAPVLCAKQYNGEYMAVLFVHILGSTLGGPASLCHTLTQSESILRAGAAA